jgi:hypothetical protein
VESGLLQGVTRPDRGSVRPCAAAVAWADLSASSNAIFECLETFHTGNGATAAGLAHPR